MNKTAGIVATLSRLYWYMAFFGHTADGFRNCGDHDSEFMRVRMVAQTIEGSYLPITFAKLIHPRSVIATCTASFLILMCGAALAQTARPAIMAIRIETQNARVIDGDLSEAVWARAVAVDDFKQNRPNPGAPPSERTVLRVLYDENNLYFSVYAYDSTPDQIAVRAMARDGPLTTGDKFSLCLDPGATRRDAYFFKWVRLADVLTHSF